MRSSAYRRLVAFTLLSAVWLPPVGLVSIAEEADGKALYLKKCAMCHGADGVAKETWAREGARNFNDPEWQKAKTDTDLVKAIADGNSDKKMPAYKDKLSSVEITAIVRHIRTLPGSK